MTIKILIAFIFSLMCVVNAAEWSMDESFGQELKEKNGLIDGYLGDSVAADQYDAERRKVQMGSCLLMDGVKTHASIPNSELFDFSNASAFSFQIEIKPITGFTKNWQRIQLMSKGADSALDSFQLIYYSKGKVPMLRWLMKQGKVIYKLEGEAKLPVRQWSTITVTADKQNVKLYLNGTLVNSLACPILPQRNRSVMKLGTYAFGHKFTFHGFMRNLKIAPQIIEPKKNITAKKLVLLESDFSKPGTTKAWKVIRGEWTRGARGYQELSDQKSADGCWTVLNKNGWNNYTFRTAVTFYDNIGSVMLGFYRRDQKNMYLLELRRSEVGIVILKLFLVSNGTKKVLQSINSSIVKFPSIKSGKTVQLQVERYNNLIVASINSKPYFCVEDSALSSGGIALGTNGRKVAFSKLEVIQYPDYIAPIKPTKRKPLLLTITNPHYRHVFVRGEEITLKIAVVNNTESKIFTAAATLDITGVSSISRQLQFKNILSNSSSSQIITIKTANLHAGDYEIKLRSILNGRQLKQYYNITIVLQPRQDRFVYRSWNGNFTEDFIQQLSKNGFNGTGLTFGMNSDYNELIKPLAKYCDAALKYGVKIRIQFPSNGQVQTGRKDTQVLRQDGSRGPLPDPHHPDHQKWSIKRLHELANIIKHYPAIDELMLTSENENKMEMSYAPAVLQLAERELGRSIPEITRKNAEIDNVKGSILSVPLAIKKSTPVVFSDNNEWYTFLKWFWQRGFGDNILNIRLHRELKKIAPGVETTHDPFRDVALFGRNQELDSVGTWFYCHPGSGEALATVEMLIAQAKGEAKSQKITLGPSLWLYSNRIGPSTARWAGVQPADIIMESLWLILSRRPDGLEHFSIRFLLPGSNPEYCPKDLLPRMNKFSENVLQPLWPMLTRLKRGQKKCAMLVSFGSRIFGKKYRAVLDKGLPLQTIIKLNVKNPVIYDLLQHCIVKYKQTAENTTFKVDLPPAGGALFAIYDRAIDSLKLNIPAIVVRGQKHLLKITVCDANNQPMPGTQPLRTIITAPDGTESEFSGYYATDKGQCQVKFNPAMNDTAGAWSITVVELSSGLEVKQLFSVR